MTDVSAGVPEGSRRGDLQLRLLATTDLHANLLSYDYSTDRAVADVGLSHAARLIFAARMGAPNSLLFDNGDFLQGSVLGDYLARAVRRRGPHPVIEAFNRLRYDAATLGNHEFNFGLPYLMSCLKDARFPFVCANLALALGEDPTQDRHLVLPFRLLHRQMTDTDGKQQDIVVGVIGFAPPQTVIWDRQNLEGRLFARDILETARAWVPVMRASGADVVVALSHSGIGPLLGATGMEDASTALAALPGVDAVICGHSHLTFPGPEVEPAPGVDPQLGRLAGKPAAMPGHSGQQIGVIDLFLRQGKRGWQVEQTATTIHSRDAAAASISTDRQATRLVREVARTAHRATLRWSRKPVGQTSTPLSTLFSLAADCPALRLVAAAQRCHVARAFAGGPYSGLPILSAVSPFKAGGRNGPHHYTHIEPGPLALRQIVDLYVFPNEIRALHLTGAQVIAWLERAAGQFLTVTPGTRDAPLINPAFPSFNFDQIDGLTYQIDLTVPDRFTGPQDHCGREGQSRIRKLMFRGEPVRPKAEFILATNSYRANGSGGFAGCTPRNIVLNEPLLIRDILLDHVKTVRNVAPPCDQIWRLAPCEGTSVLFDSAPEAAFKMALVPGLQLEPLALTPNGFQRFRLHL